MTGKDALALVRDAAATFAGFSALAYAAGYLALRARARALGIDPGFSLLDEVYVFSGFRFVLSLLFTLLLLTPALWVVRAWMAWIEGRPRLRAWVSGLAVLVLAAAVLAQFQVLDVRGLLLTLSPHGVLAEAALGRNAWGVALFFVAVAASALGALWLYDRLRRERYGGLTPALAIIVALQLLFLPAVQGVFFADREVRVLERPPESAPSLTGRVGLVDRSKDKVVLLEVAGASEPRLVTLAADRIDGIGVTRIVTLSQFLDELRTAPAACQAPAGAHADAEPFWRLVLGELQHTLENIGSLGEGRASIGAVFVADIDGGRLLAPPRRLSARGDLSWPVIGSDGTVYALDGGRLVRLTPAGTTEASGPQATTWRKLVGVGPGGVVAGVLAEPSPFGRPALLSRTGALQVGPPPTTIEERRRQGVLLQESQALEGGRSLRVGRSERGGRGFDVFYAQAGAERLDVSDCGDDSCGQPSIAPDGSKIVYIRQARE